MSGEEYLHPETGLPKGPNGDRAFLISLEARVKGFALGLYVNHESNIVEHPSVC
jgi:hypothetical protein